MPSGTTYYTGWNTGAPVVAGTTATYHSVLTNDKAWTTISIDGVTYGVPASAVVRGYTGPVFTIDRWSLTGGTLTVVDGGIKLTTTARIASRLELAAGKALVGKTLTASLLVDNNLIQGTFELTDAMPYTVIASINGWRLAVSGYTESNGLTFQIYNLAGKDTDTVRAAKLELGSVQTLAHQDENGNWVLNDPPPNKNLELLKCCMNTADISDTYANNKLTPAAINAVNKAGDKMTGHLEVAIPDMYKIRIGGDDLGAYMLTVHNDASDYRALGLYHPGSTPLDKNSLVLWNNKAKTLNTVLHTGNKTSGSYTGNGSAVERIIPTYGIGEALLIESEDGMVIMSTTGALICNTSNNSVQYISANGDNSNMVAYLDNDSDKSFHIKTTRNELNENGQTYWWIMI